LTSTFTCPRFHCPFLWKRSAAAKSSTRRRAWSFGRADHEAERSPARHIAGQAWANDAILLALPQGRENLELSFMGTETAILVGHIRAVECRKGWMAFWAPATDPGLTGAKGNGPDTPGRSSCVRWGDPGADARSVRTARMPALTRRPALDQVVQVQSTVAT
jgi:hypothetical protein